MSKEREKYCYFIINYDDIVEPPQSSEIQNAFVKGTLDEKKKSLKLLIKMISNDDNYPRMLMPVLTNLQLNQDHELKKLLFLYWEVVEKTNLDGSVKDEITLACNALRKDLLSPNEFIRGRTLRLVSKITIKSILENLVQAVIENLTHRHFYVRRNAIMCIYSIFQSTGTDLIEDCIDSIDTLLINETDLSTKRNAFFLLFHLAQEKALAYLKTLMSASDDPVQEMGDIFQLIVLEMLRKLCKIEPSQKQRLMNAIFMLSNSKSSSVLFECANTITQLTTAPTAIKIAIQSYLNLLQDQNDNNVKLIVLNKIMELRLKYAKLLEDYITDILNTINEESISSLEINEKVLELTTELASSRNIKEIIGFLEKEIVRARKMDESGDQASTTNEYRYLLIKSISTLTQNFPETIPNVLRPLMDSFLMFDNRSTYTSLETILFIREIIEVHPEHRQAIFDKICDNFEDIRSHLVIRVALWIIGEYATSQRDVERAFDTIKKNIGALPLFSEDSHDPNTPGQEESKTSTSGPKVITKTIILPDGSYGTETIVLNDPAQAKLQHTSASDENLPLRKALINTDDDYLCSCLAITLTKLSIKAKKNLSGKFNQMAIDSILIICALLKGQQLNKKKHCDPDSKQRMQLCLRVLSNPNGLSSLSAIENLLVDLGKRVFAKFLETHSKLTGIGAKKTKKGEESLLITQPDEMVVFRQLKGRTGATDFDITEELSGDAGNGLGNEDFMKDVRKDIDAKIYQMTGYSDAIYAEAFVEVHHYDILLKILLVNRTNKTVPNIQVELLTQGNLKIVEKPQATTLRALSSQTVKASLKVSSTDNGAIYGYITFDSASGNIPNIININEIQIDFINELQPAECSELDFKKKWADYEWENKVHVNTGSANGDLREYVENFAKIMNVKLMTPISEQDQLSGFLVSNLYTKSKFEEDCLINLSIEKSSSGDGSSRITGLIRVRAKTEGMALCIGEKCKALK
eukprot:403342367